MEYSSTVYTGLLQGHANPCQDCRTTLRYCTQKNSLFRIYRLKNVQGTKQGQEKRNRIKKRHEGGKKDDTDDWKKMEDVKHDRDLIAQGRRLWISDCFGC